MSMEPALDQITVDKGAGPHCLHTTATQQSSDRLYRMGAIASFRFMPFVKLLLVQATCFHWSYFTLNWNDLTPPLKDKNHRIGSLKISSYTAQKEVKGDLTEDESSSKLNTLSSETLGSWGVVQHANEGQLPVSQAVSWVHLHGRRAPSLICKMGIKTKPVSDDSEL